MYITVNTDTHKRLIKANSKSPSVSTKLAEIAENPLNNAIRTHIPAMGDYYINAGRWCILFNVKETEEVVDVLSIVLSPYLHKILTGRIGAPGAN